MKTKLCKSCNVREPLDNFHKAYKLPNGKYHYQSICKYCYSAKRKKYYLKNKTKFVESKKKYIKNNPKSVVKAYLKHKYGLTLEEYTNMFMEQKGCCAICGRHQTEFKTRLCVDHNHRTGKIRGLLCGSCNFGLGSYEKNKGRYKRYLEKYDTK